MPPKRKSSAAAAASIGGKKKRPQRKKQHYKKVATATATAAAAAAGNNNNNGDSSDTTKLPPRVAQQVQDFIEDFDYELYKDHLDALGQHIFEELHVLLDDDEEAYVMAGAGAAQTVDEEDDDDDNDEDDDESSRQHFLNRMQHVIALAWHRQQRAERAFELLDQAGKGVIVFEDLRRVVNDFLEKEITDDDIEEMIREIDQSNDGILTKPDFYRLANKIGL